MARSLNPDELDAMLVAYALDTLDRDERALVEEHLAADPMARQLLADYERVVAALAIELGPPDHVWDRLAHLVFPDQPVPHQRRFAQGHRLRRPEIPIVYGLVAAVCVAALAVGVTLAVTPGRSSSASSLVSAARRAAATAGARTVVLRRPDGTVGASAVVLLDGSGYLTSHLARLGIGRTYQLWVMDADSLVSLGVLGSQPHVVAFTLVSAARRLIITDEAAGGVAATHQIPSAIGDLPDT